VAALTLGHIDWKRERLHVPERKGVWRALGYRPRLRSTARSLSKRCSRVALGDREDTSYEAALGKIPRSIAAGIERYLAHKRALACRFRTGEKALCLLDRFLVERGVKAIDEIGPELIEAFLVSRPRTRPRSYNHLPCTVRRL
jgi:hypothetical protein